MFPKQLWNFLDRWRPTYLAFQANRWCAYHAIGAAVGSVLALKVTGWAGVGNEWAFYGIMALSVAVELMELASGIPPCVEPGKETEWWAWDSVGDLVIAAVVSAAVCFG